MIYTTPPIGSGELAAVGRIEKLRGDLRFYVSEPRRWLGPVRRILAARAIQGSNSIEGYDVSVEDAVAAIEGNEAHDAIEENWKAVTSYRRAMTYVIQLSDDPHFVYTPELIKSLHYMITEYDLGANPGLWRPRPIWVRNDVTGDIVYEGPAPDVVPVLISELVDQLQGDDDGPGMIRAAMAHLNLVMIHPFSDGNGRMSRCLQTLVLAREGRVVPEFASIEEYLGRNTQSYYQVLGDVGQGAWSPTNDAAPWVRYCLEGHFIQAASVLRRVRESERLWAELDDQIAIHGLADRTIEALFDATIDMKVRNSSYRANIVGQGLPEISNQTATNDLRSLVEAGLLIQRGAKRGTYYVSSEILDEINREIRKDRVPLTIDGLFDAKTAA